MKYKAFISYRHCEPDSAAAKKIMRAVETYGIPKIIAEKHHMNKHVGKLFRDEDELSAADDLSEVITEALDDSEYLIMICSPRYIESNWCMLEVQHWINRNGRKNIIAVLLEGEPDTSFPKILTDYEENGKQVHVEPLAVDIRGETQKDILKNIDSGKLRILSPLIGCNYDDLRQRQQERTRRNVIASAASVFSVLAVIIGIVLAANARLSAQNAIITSQNIELEEFNSLIADQNNELENKNSEIEEANRSLLKMNITAMNKMAENNAISGNYIPAVQYMLAAYNAAKEAGLDTSEYFRKLIEYIDPYNENGVVKAGSTSFSNETTSNNPNMYKLFANEQYCVMMYSNNLYGYDVLTGNMIHYKKTEYSMKKLFMLDGARYAVLNDESDGNSGRIFTVTVVDMLNDEEYTYSGNGKIADGAYFDGVLTVLTENDWYGTVFLLDNDCKLIGEPYETGVRSPQQILNSETILGTAEFYNFKTKESTSFGLIDYSKSSDVSEISSNDFKYSFDDKTYYYNEDNYQYSRAMLSENMLIYNQFHYGSHISSIGVYDFNADKYFKISDVGINGNLRFAYNEAGTLCARATDNYIYVDRPTENGKATELHWNNSAPVRKLLINDDYLIVIFYEFNPAILKFDIEADTFSMYQFDEMYTDAVLCGDVLHMLSPDRSVIDTFYCNGMKNQKFISIDKNETAEYKNTKISAGVNIGDAMSFYADRGEDEPPEYYFINTIDGSVSGHYVPDIALSQDTYFYRTPEPKNNFMGWSDGGGYYERIIPNYKEQINYPETINDNTIDLGTDFLCNGTYIYHTEEQEDGSNTGSIYDAVTGELIEKITLFDNEADYFYTNGNIRAEWHHYSGEMEIYDGTELIQTFLPAFKNGNVLANILDNCQDTILIHDGRHFIVFSLSERKEIVRFDYPDYTAGNLEFSCEEANGKNYILLASRYLINTDDWSVVNDFGKNDNYISVSNFYFNEYLGLWGLAGIDGTAKSMTFFDPETFEEVFTIDRCWAASPDGKYIYVPSVNMLSGYLMQQIPLIKDEDELVEKATEILNIFGITEDMLSIENILG